MLPAVDFCNEATLNGAKHKKVMKKKIVKVLILLQAGRFLSISGQ